MLLLAGLAVSGVWQLAPASTLEVRLGRFLGPLMLVYGMASWQAWKNATAALPVVDWDLLEVDINSYDVLKVRAFLYVEPHGSYYLRASDATAEVEIREIDIPWQRIPGRRGVQRRFTIEDGNVVNTVSGGETLHLAEPGRIAFRAVASSVGLDQAHWDRVRGAGEITPLGRGSKARVKVRLAFKTAGSEKPYHVEKTAALDLVGDGRVFQWRWGQG